MLKAFFIHHDVDVNHFQRAAVPLIDLLPGVQRWTWNVGIPDPVSGAPPPFGLITELWFKDVEGVRTMLGSAELQRSRRELSIWSRYPDKRIVMFAHDGREIPR